MNKKIIASIICLIFCFSNVANAEMKVTINDEKNAVVVKGTSEKEDLLITMLKSGSTMEELYSAFAELGGNPEDFLLYYKQLETENGKYSDTIMMSDSAQKGEYLLTVGDEQQIVSYSPLSFRLGLIEQFIGAQNGKDIDKIIRENKNYIGLWDMYNNLSNKPIVADIVYERIGKFTLTANDLNSWKAIVALINNAILVSALNDNLVDSFDTVKEMIYADTEIEDMYSLLGGITKEGVALVLKNCTHGNFETYTSFKKMLMQQLALQAFNCPVTVDSDSLIGIMGSYKDILGLTLTSFNSLSKANKAACVSKLSAEKCSLEMINTQLQAIASSFTVAQPSTSGNSKGVSKTVTLNDDNNSVNEKEDFEVFSDMESFEWAKEAVTFLQKKGIITGYDAGKFGPANHVTRCEFVVLAVKATYQTSDANNVVFSDVDTDHWGYKYIMTAYEKGIIKGMDNGNFLPDKEITREDIAVILSNILNDTNTEESSEKFTDDGEISGYAYDSVYQLKSLGIISGNSDGTFIPKADASRAEAAQMIYNFLEKRESAAVTDKQISSVTPINKHQDEYNLLVALGVADSTFDYNYSSLVKKDAFTQMVANAAKLSDGYNATGNVYADVPTTNEHAAAIEMLANACSETADGTAYFYPHSNITLEAAIKIIFDATGYSSFAKAIGDGGYLSLANEKNMQKNIHCGWNDEISGNDALVLIHNMLNLNQVHITAKNTYAESSSKTLLEELHEVYAFNGIICANSLTTFYAKSELPDNSILLETGGKYVQMNCGITDAEDSLGMYATVYYKLGKNDDNPVIVYFSSDGNKNTVENISIDNIEVLSESKISYNVDDKKISLFLSSGKVFIYNDTYYSGNALTQNSLDDKVGNLVAIDNNNDGKYDVIKITAYDTYVVNNVLLSDGIIYDKYNPSMPININKDNYKKYSLKFADESKAELADMRNETVVSIAKNADGCSIHAVKIIISNKKVSGIVTEYENDSYPHVTLDYNAEYKLLNNANASFPGMGVGILAYLDAFSNIAYISSANSGGYYYGLALAVAKSKDLSASVQMKIYSQDNQMHIYSLNDTVTIDGSKYKNGADIYTKLSSIGKFKLDEADLPNGVYPVRYFVNDNGKITEVDTSEKKKDETENSLTLVSNGKYIYTTDGCLGYTIPTKSSTYVLKIVLPSNYEQEDIENEDNLSFRAPSSAFSRGSSYSVAAFTNDSQSLYPDFIVTRVGYGFDYADPLMMISSINQVYDSESEMVLPSVKGIRAGSEVSVTVSDKFAADFISKNLVSGDVIRYIVDNKNQMIEIDGKAAIVKYDLIGKQVKLGNINQGSTAELASTRSTDRSAHLMYGYVKLRQEGLLQIVYWTYGNGALRDIRPNDIAWDASDNIINVSISSTTPVTVYDPSNGRNNQVYSGTYDDIKDHIHNGEDYSLVLLKYRSSELKEVIVFNDASLAQ